MNGLNLHEIEYRINNDMVNNKIIKNSRSFKKILLSNVFTLFNLIHIVLFILVLTTGSLVNATFIITICVNLFISIFQEIKAKKMIDNLTIANNVNVKVVRTGKIIKILPTEIVLDDLLYLEHGDSLVVDAKIIKANDFEVDESIITGESNSVIKTDGDNLISGTVVICGNAYAKVISINKDTYVNNLIKDTSLIVDESSYLKKCINAILKIVTILIIPVGILLFITQFYSSNQTYSQAILSSVAGIIGMIPEGLVLLTSISLTIGVIKMTSKKVIIQKLDGIELLSCVDVLCFDKTGTITDGSMEVINVIKIDDYIDINNIISNMVINPINATDLALFKYFNKNHDLKIIDSLPFSSTRKYSLVNFEIGMYAIGALEYMTNKNIEDYSELTNYINNGYRILSLVFCDKEFNKDTNKVVGFIILKDNIRTNAKEILEYFKNQNVDIKIISGDNPKTVYNIFKQLSIDGYDNYISGDKLPSDYSELSEIVNDYNIFGRVTPYQKRDIIKALKENYTVGMIGDGVNDILALKEANCAITLASGVAAARNVSEVILTESDFEVLPYIVNEGRRVVNNIEKVSSMYLIKTVYSFIISLFCIFLIHEYPFYPVQLTLISVTCVGLPSFFLALEPNYNKVKNMFLVRVLKNALSSGICVSINILFLMILSDYFKFDFDLFRVVVVFITGYLNLRLLYKISLPLSFFRKTLLFISSIVFIMFLLLFNDFFLIPNINFISFILICIFIIIDNYICLFLETIYDKIVLKILKDKKEKDVL